MARFTSVAFMIVVTLAAVFPAFYTMGALA